jgi:hypothetical protein
MRSISRFITDNNEGYVFKVLKNDSSPAAIKQKEGFG